MSYTFYIWRYTDFTLYIHTYLYSLCHTPSQIHIVPDWTQTILGPSLHLSTVERCICPQFWYFFERFICPKIGHKILYNFPMQPAITLVFSGLFLVQFCVNFCINKETLINACPSILSYFSWLVSWRPCYFVCSFPSIIVFASIVLLVLPFSYQSKQFNQLKQLNQVQQFKQY